MRITFLATAKGDLRWFKRYYTSAFPDGRQNADRQFVSAQKAIRQHPLIGHPSVQLAGAREFHIQRTPFSLIYRIVDDRIEVLRVLDGRGER
jgi:plasmid stabilization system protein ParE